MMGVNLSTPSTLYHYTSAQAFLSIIKSGRIWATHVRFLNDTSDAEWMWQTALQRLRVRKEAAASGEETGFIVKLMDLIAARKSCTDFVASFSENGDDLSQWRAYCHDAPGFSIGFSSAALQTQWVCNPLGRDPFFVGGALKKVIYLSEGDPTTFDNQLEIVLNHIAPALDGHEGFHGPMSKEQYAAAWLAAAASAFKHSSFRDEHEWRLITSKPHKPMPGQRFRPGRSSLIPYVEVELNRNHRSERMAERIINRVIVGPSPDPELSMQAAKSFFLSIGQPDVEILRSSTPYKNW